MAALNVLDDIDLHRHTSQFVGLVGPSGAGKRSLLKLVLTLFNPKSQIFGARTDPKKLRRREQAKQ